MQAGAFVLEAAFVLGVVTATDPPAQLSDTVPRATLMGGCKLHFSGTRFSSWAMVERCHPQGGSLLPAWLLPPCVSWETLAEGLGQTRTVRVGIS